METLLIFIHIIEKFLIKQGINGTASFFLIDTKWI